MNINIPLDHMHYFTKSEVKEVDRKFDDLTEIMIAGFERLDAKMDSKFAAIDTKLTGIESSLIQIKSHFGIVPVA